MKSTDASDYQKSKTCHTIVKDKRPRPIIFILLAVFVLMLSGCLPNIEEELQEAIGEYAEEHKEEFILLQNIPIYFGHSPKTNKQQLPPDDTTTPLYSYLVGLTKEDKPTFSLTTLVIHFHYPFDFKEVTSEERVLIGVSDISNIPPAHKPGALRSNLTVFERDNKNKTDVLYAQCRFLLQIYGYPPGTDSEIGNFVWLFCRCTWDAQKQTWKVSNIRRLSDGETIPG